ncbi:MAG: HAD family hydrolase [Phocaeicola sp.]
MKTMKGIIFDYGGTLDSNGVHWAEVLWAAYQRFEVPITRAEFREAYVHGERTLAREPWVKPTHTFKDVLFIKVMLQFEYLQSKGNLSTSAYPIELYISQIATACYEGARQQASLSREVVEQLSKGYQLVLVSNFYGNIHTILKDFGLLSYFGTIIESAVVGVRKPDPAIFSLGVDALRLPAEDILVVGDSFSKDIVPAHSLGCKTVWLKGPGWGDEVIDETVPSAIITDLAQLPQIIETQF